LIRGGNEKSSSASQLNGCSNVCSTRNGLMVVELEKNIYPLGLCIPEHFE
jgi:hypothetical protein